MSDVTYHFYCVRCRPGQTFSGATIPDLCESVNDHNDEEHDTLVTWTPDNITFSDYYHEKTSLRALPQYTAPFGTAKNSHMDRFITADDRKFLAEVGTRW